MHYAGLIFDDSRHYIDHLAPFCALQKWPLIACEGAVADLCRRYYPGLEVIEANIWNLSLPSTLVSCYPARLIQSAFPSSASCKILWLPHGNSDKGWKVPFFEALQRETALIYGQKMQDFLHKKHLSLPTVRIGNFRLRYWMQHRSFYDALALPLPPADKTYLYAPTWNDEEGNGSFWQMFPCLAAHLPSDCSLIVKIHPNTLRQQEIEIERLKGKYERNRNIVFLPEFPPIYPLLNRCSAYIGDMSSIGYDFLHWNRPMYFLNAKKENLENDPSLFLYRCGVCIAPEDAGAIFYRRDDDSRFTDIRKQVYAYTFDRSAQYGL